MRKEIFRGDKMGKLSIHTEVYTKELMGWIEENSSRIHTKSKNGNVCLIEIDCDEKCKKSLSILLEEIILNKNPITKGYKSIYENVKNLVFLPHREDIYKELNSFLEENDTINLEGYTDFRMDAYAHLINLVLYAVVKKSF